MVGRKGEEIKEARNFDEVNGNCEKKSTGITI